MKPSRVLQMHPKAFRSEEAAKKAGQQLAGEGGYFEVKFASVQCVKVAGPLGTESTQPAPEYFVYY